MIMVFRMGSERFDYNSQLLSGRFLVTVGLHYKNPYLFHEFRLIILKKGAYYALWI
jgi:hypothetical protein